MDGGGLLNDARRNRDVFDMRMPIRPGLQMYATNHVGSHFVISVQRMLHRLRLITVSRPTRLLLNKFDFSRAVRQKRRP